MNTLADQVVEFTIMFVRALQRTGQLDPTRASFGRARARLWKELGRLHRTQREIGYIVSPPSVAGGPPELWVDGNSPMRTELRRMAGASARGVFIQWLLEHMKQRGLVMLSFSRGITEAEWYAFLDVMSEPCGDEDPTAAGHHLLQAMLAKKVTRISLVRDEDAAQVPGELPWQIRFAYARLARDLWVCSALGQGTRDDLMGQAETLVAGMAYSFFRRYDILRQLLLHADVVNALVQQTPGLAGVDALALIVQGLPVIALNETTSLIFKNDPCGEEPPAPPVSRVLAAIAERLLGMPSSRQVDEALRAMCRRQIVPITRLPVDLQEWVLAEQWVDALRGDPAAEAPRGGAGSDPIRILQKGARYAFSQKLFAEGMEILRRIAQVDWNGVPAVFDLPTVEVLLELLPSSPEDKRALADLLVQGGETAARSTAMALVTAEQKVAELAAWVLTQMKDLGVAAALAALDQDIDKPDTVRLLLSCVAGKAPESAAPVFVRQLAHKSPRVRRDALTALVSASPATANLWVARALADPDETVRIRALLLCAGSGVGGEQVIPKAIKIVSEDARGASPQIVRAAIEVVIRRWEAGALAVAQAEAALCRLAAPIGVMGKVLGHTPPPPAVLLMAIAALGRLGTERAASLLVKLERSKDTAVAQAATRTLDGKAQTEDAVREEA